MEISKIRKRLSSEAAGGKLFVYGEVGSTNDVLARLFREGSADDGTAVIADSQTAGRGRLGRKWISPGGKNLYLSVLFRPDIAPHGSPVFTFLGSLALESVFSRRGVDVSIKWPNDILAGGKKMAGVLTEMGCSEGKVDYLIIGVGVNLNLSAGFIRREMKDVSEKVTSLSILLGEEVDREEFAAELVDSLRQFRSMFAREGAGAVTRLWSEKWGRVGREISIDSEGETLRGVVERVDENGFLRLRTRGGGILKVTAGDAVF